MRRTYIVSYDIADPKRLRQVLKVCRDYGDHLQYSVFECDLSDQEGHELAQKLAEIIHYAEDQVLFIDLGPTERRGDRLITSIGLPYTKWDDPCYVA